MFLVFPVDYFWTSCLWTRNGAHASEYTIRIFIKTQWIIGKIDKCSIRWWWFVPFTSSFHERNTSSSAPRTNAIHPRLEGNHFFMQPVVSLKGKIQITSADFRDYSNFYINRINNIDDLRELGLALSDLSLHGHGRSLVMNGLQHNSR